MIIIFFLFTWISSLTLASFFSIFSLWAWGSRNSWSTSLSSRSLCTRKSRESIISRKTSWTWRSSISFISSRSITTFTLINHVITHLLQVHDHFVKALIKCRHSLPLVHTILPLKALSFLKTNLTKFPIH